MTLDPKPSNLKKPTSNGGNNRLRDSLPVRVMLRALLLVFVLLLIAIIIFYVVIGTPGGTRFFVEKIVSETGIDIVYDEGNLRDGLKVKEIKLDASEDISVHIMDAYIQLGWRALFNKEVHLSHTKIGRIEVVNQKPPTNTPFDYKTLQLPVNLRFDSVKIDTIEYDQAEREPIVVTNVLANDLNWIDTTVNTRDTALLYGELFKITNLNGYIDLQGEYALDASAEVTVNALNKVYFDSLNIHAKGSLKLTTGEVISRYNGQQVSGEFAVQGVAPDVPFDAKLNWDEVVLPYATSQEIVLQTGSVLASGNIKKFELQVDTLLKGKYIPLANYQGEAVVTDSQMQVNQLTATSPHGDLSAQGLLDWRSSFKMDSTIKGSGFKLRQVIPEDYKAYAPQTLDGTLDFDLDTDPNSSPQTSFSATATDSSNNTANTATITNNNPNTDINSQLRMVARLKQRDGEYIKAIIDKGVEPKLPRFSAPWYIDASWQNVKRQDIPSIGNLDSPYGKAYVQTRDGKFWVDAKARINELNAAPMGDYKVKVSKNGHQIAIKTLDYEGVIGDLRGTGKIMLATQTKPLSWQIDANTHGLNPNLYRSSLPVSNLTGHITGSGTMATSSKNIGGIVMNTQHHNFDIRAADLRAVLITDTANDKDTNSDINASTDSQVVHIQGMTDGSVDLLQGEVEKFAVKFNGSLGAQNIGADVPQGNLVVDVFGTPKDITVNTLKHTGEVGVIDAKGKLNLSDGVAWDISATADEFNFGFFTPQVDGKLSGDLISSGRWRANNTKVGKLEAFDIDFDGSIDTPQLPKGTFVIDASIDTNDATKSDGGTGAGTGTGSGTQAVIIRKFEHKGDAGNISVTGQVNVQDRIEWDIDATADKFDLSFFVPQTEAIITGDLVTSGKWQSDKDIDNADSIIDGLQAFDINFDGNLDTPKLPQGRLKINASGNHDKVHITQFSHVGDAGRINAKGDVDITDGINWQINAVMNNFNVGYFIQDAPSTLTGHIDTSGSWQDDVQRINIADMVLKGKLKGEPLTAQGRLSASLHLPTDIGQYFDTLQAVNRNGNSTTDARGQLNNQVTQIKALVETLDAQDVALLWGNNQVVINGDAKRLQANVNVASLSDFSRDIRGSVQGGLTLVQTQQDNLPTLYIDLTAKRVALSSFALQSGVIKGKVVDLGLRPSTVAMTLNDLNVADREFESLTALFTGTESEHVLSAKISHAQATIDTVLKGGLTQDNDKIRWTGVMGDAQITSKYVGIKQRQPAQIVIDLPSHTSNRASSHDSGYKLQIAAHCWIANNNNGKLCLRDNLIASPTQGQVNVAIQQIDTRLLAPLLPKDISWKAKVDGNAIIGWQQNADPTINATIYSDNGRIGMTQEGNVPDATLPYKRVSVIALSVPSGLKLRTDIDNGHGGQGYADIVIDPYSEDKTISGKVALNDINVALFKPFFPGMRTLEGQLKLAGQVDGSLSRPIFNGDVKLMQARLAMLELPINLSNINIDSHIQGRRATIDGTFNSGDGAGTLTGDINWQQDLQAKLSIEGERLIITQPPALFAEVTPDIDIIVRPQDKYVDIQGTVLVPTATLRPPEANEDVITESADVVVLDRRLIGNIDEVLAISKPWSINADIGIDLGNDVNFRGFGAVLPLAGAITVSQRGQENMKALGVIQVARRSNVDVFGQSLDLNYGQVRFNGDVLNPKISIEAVKDIEDQTVGLRVKGNVSEPNIVVFNDAGLTEQQAMNALITDRISNTGATQISAEGFKSQVTNNLAAAGLSIGLSGTRGLTNSIGQAFGLQRLTVDASGNSDDTNVNVTGYITPDLYIRYGVGVFNAETTLSMRYQLTRRIYIEATSATENAIDVVYSWEF